MRINLDLTQKVNDKTFLALRVDKQKEELKPEFIVGMLTNEQIDELENDLLEIVINLVKLREKQK
jgi:hypothetical protein